MFTGCFKRRRAKKFQAKSSRPKSSRKYTPIALDQSAATVRVAAESV
jgi:hypothetical protein